MKMTELLNEQNPQSDTGVESQVENQVDNHENEEVLWVSDLDGDIDENKHIPVPVHNEKEVFPPPLTDQEKAEIDGRSIYVGNVDYGSTAADLENHFKGCGVINKITILTNKQTGHPKGFAYIEFENQSAIELAMLLNESVFRQRQIKVMQKRTNIHGYVLTQSHPSDGPRQSKKTAPSQNTHHHSSNRRRENSIHSQNSHNNRLSGNIKDVMRSKEEVNNKSFSNARRLPRQPHNASRPNTNMRNVDDYENRSERNNRDPKMRMKRNNRHTPY